MGNRKLYTTCPWCGARSIKATPGSEVEARCPKCESDLLVQINDSGAILVKIIRQGKDQTA